MIEHPGFSLSVVLRYFLLPATVLGLITLWHLRTERSHPGWPVRGDRAVWWLISAFWGVYGTMGVLRYLAYRTTIQDLGFYDQRIWTLSNVWPFPSPSQIVSTFRHFSPIVAPHILAYKVYASAAVLIGLQVVAVGVGAYPIYHLAKRRLGPEAALALAAGYLLYPSVVFNVLFDFHPDHLFIPLLLFAFYFLEVGNPWGLALSGVLMLLVKESLVPTVAVFGIYTALVKRRYLLGAVVALGSAVFFWLVVMPRSPGLFKTGGTAESHGYLGASLPEIVGTVLTSPGVWLPEVVQVPKLKFLFLMLAPLMFLPVLAPKPLLVALPGLFMTLLSRGPHQYQIWAQYAAPLIPPLFVAAVFGSQRLMAIISGNTARWRRMGTVLPLWITGAALYFNVVFSPSPLSTTFWLGEPERLRWSYHFRAVFLADRDRDMREALHRYVPADPEVIVASQNSVNSSHLAHRHLYAPFPYATAAYVVVDVKRPLYVNDRIDAVAFEAELEQLRRDRQVLYESDGFLIFGPKVPRTRP